ncbi:hypothetical protein KP509_25G045400 [Ceratopteris richardii]|uniref:Uncharacterized protein n=1 Tax=Ceratopteris richardii TaxID=49495 RepID=A0A8T2RS48_CERRI|nr:hypothetical protein KP509_25G045400 [Ceratopteris richardii]
MEGFLELLIHMPRSAIARKMCIMGIHHLCLQKQGRERAPELRTISVPHRTIPTAYCVKIAHDVVVYLFLCPLLLLHLRGASSTYYSAACHSACNNIDWRRRTLVLSLYVFLIHLSLI